jgi:hypothetical protein
MDKCCPMVGQHEEGNLQKFVRRKERNLQSVYDVKNEICKWGTHTITNKVCNVVSKVSIFVYHIHRDKCNIRVV